MHVMLVTENANGQPDTFDLSVDAEVPSSTRNMYAETMLWLEMFHVNLKHFHRRWVTWTPHHESS